MEPATRAAVASVPGISMPNSRVRESFLADFGSSFQTIVAFADGDFRP